MPEPAYAAHARHVLTIYEQALAAAQFDAVVVDAGRAHRYFLDDADAPLRRNPLFAYLTPLPAVPGSLILMRPGENPRLLWVQPEDYWHMPPAAPDPVFSAPFEVDIVATEAAGDALARQWIRAGERVAWLGEQTGRASSLGCHTNPAALLDYVHWHRARKTAHEIACMEAATECAVRGHRAALQGFAAGASEFDLHCAYLAASRQIEAELPYPNIIAFDRHAAVLHYQHYARTGAAKGSLLIDAGGRHLGYAADITRTHARPGAGEFAALIEAMDRLQQQIVAEIVPGNSYVDLHLRSHELLAELLIEAELADGSPSSLIETGITRAFLPHGLGHLLGLQTHDVGGLIADDRGTPNPPPERDPALRNTRTIEVGQVFTIEPGLYFIDLLLAPLRRRADGHNIRWASIDRLAPHGGIRIEDNVVVTEHGTVNLTRAAFERASEPGDAAERRGLLRTPRPAPGPDSTRHAPRGPGRD